MKFMLVSVFIHLIIINLSAQRVFWSEMNREDVIQAIERSKSLVDLISKNEYASINPYISFDSIFVGENSWLELDIFKDKLILNTKDKIFRDTKFIGYQFDDFLDQYDGNDIIKRIYPVFDNHSVLVAMDYQTEGLYKNALFVFKKVNNYLKLVGLQGFDISGSDVSSLRIDERDYRMERISQAGITLPVPNDFSGPDKLENQVVYYLKGETDRDAVFQVLIDELKTNVHYYTYKFVEFSNQQYDLSELTVRYLPYGILFEYTVKDSFGTINKGITVGMENNDQMIIIQFYAFYDVYQRRKEDIDIILKNIRR